MSFLAHSLHWATTIDNFLSRHNSWVMPSRALAFRYRVLMHRALARYFENLLHISLPICTGHFWWVSLNTERSRRHRHIYYRHFPSSFLCTCQQQGHLSIFRHVITASFLCIECDILALFISFTQRLALLLPFGLKMLSLFLFVSICISRIDDLLRIYYHATNNSFHYLISSENIGRKFM